VKSVRSPCGFGPSWMKPNWIFLNMPLVIGPLNGLELEMHVGHGLGLVHDLGLGIAQAISLIGITSLFPWNIPPTKVKRPLSTCWLLILVWTSYPSHPLTRGLPSFCTSQSLPFLACFVAKRSLHFLQPKICHLFLFHHSKKHCVWPYDYIQWHFS